MLAFDEIHLVFGRGLGEEVVYSCLARDSCCRKRIVAGDHHRLNPHGPEVIKTLPDTTLHDVFKFDYSQRAAAFLGNHQRRSAGACDLLNDGLDLIRYLPALL